MLFLALGAAAAGAGWRTRAAALAEDLSSTDPAHTNSARAAIAAEFGLEPGPFARLAAVNAEIDGQTPTDAEWLDIEAILTNARKRKLEYPAWLDVEQSL